MSEGLLAIRLRLRLWLWLWLWLWRRRPAPGSGALLPAPAKPKAEDPRTSRMLRPPRAEETPALLAIALRTGLFSPAEADALLRSTLDALHDGTLGDEHVVRVAVPSTGESPLGWFYLAPDPGLCGAWNVWWIGVDPSAHGRGVGVELLADAERIVRDRGGRVIVIETSDAPRLARARHFYSARGYAERGRIPDFYAPGESKVIVSKTLQGGDSGR